MGVGWRNATVTLVVALGLAAPAAAEDQIIVTPVTAGALSSDSGYFRTNDPQPTFSIQAPEGIRAVCTVAPWDSANSIAGPCGPPLPGCTAAYCASYRPASPVNGAYLLTVQTYDEFGTELGIGGITYAVDHTPPDTSVQLASEIGDLRPFFDVAAKDDDPLSANVDTFQCSLGRLGAPPTWASCSPALDGSAQAPFAVPRRHIDWQMQVRAVDDLGRPDPTPASARFDPVPCVIKAHNVSISRLISSGIPVTVQCSYFRHVALWMFSLDTNGKHRVSIKYAMSHRLPLGQVAVNGKTPRFKVTKKLRLYKHYDRYYRGDHSADIVVEVFDPQDEAPVKATSVAHVFR